MLSLKTTPSAGMVTVDKLGDKLIMNVADFKAHAEFKLDIKNGMLVLDLEEKAQDDQGVVVKDDPEHGKCLVVPNDNNRNFKITLAQNVIKWEFDENEPLKIKGSYHANYKAKLFDPITVLLEAKTTKNPNKTPHKFDLNVILYQPDAQGNPTVKLPVIIDPTVLNP